MGCGFFFWGVFVGRGGFGGEGCILLGGFLVVCMRLCLKFMQRLTMEFFFVGKEEATQSDFVCLEGRVFGPSVWFRPMAPGLFSVKTFRCFRFSNFILL